jgi:hypothetical protein
MRWLACAWLLLVGGCFEPPDGPSYRVTLVTANPPVVSVHGGEWVTVVYDGELPDLIAVDVDGVFGTIISHDPDSRTFTISAPTHAEGAGSLGVIDVERGRRMAFEPDFLAFRLMPALPAFNLSGNTELSLTWPLHPELSRPCARGGDVYLANYGDAPLTFTGARSTNEAFTIQPSPCATLAYSEMCTFSLCFTSTTPGPHMTTLVASTDAGDIAANVQATVTPALSGLDPTFHGGGVVFDEGNDATSGRGAVGPSGILTWARARAIAIDAAGVETHHDIALFIGTAAANQIVAMRTGPSGSGIYALVVNSNVLAYGMIVRFNNALVPDNSPGAQVELPYESGNPYYDLQVAPSGRLLAIGSVGVVAIANGAVDTTYGTSGRAAFPGFFSYSSAIDSQGRLYAALNNKLVRVTANGTIDGSFVYNFSVDALTIDSADRVYVQRDFTIARLTETGTEDLTISTTLFAYELAIDASGRIYVVSGNTVSRFTNGVFETTVGYGTEYSAICPPSGGCYLLGADMVPTIPFSSGPPDYLEKYVLRLAD